VAAAGNAGAGQKVSQQHKLGVKLLSCSVCRTARYCSAACQRVSHLLMGMRASSWR
jgi:hypothetical protein